MEKKPNLCEFNINKYIPPELKVGYIIATYQINREDLDKKIQILNCRALDKKELENNCEIYFEEQLINFSFVYTFAHP